MDKGPSAGGGATAGEEGEKLQLWRRLVSSGSLMSLGSRHERDSASPTQCQTVHLRYRVQCSLPGHLETVRAHANVHAAVNQLASDPDHVDAISAAINTVSQRLRPHGGKEAMKGTRSKAPPRDRRSTWRRSPRSRASASEAAAAAAAAADAWASASASPHGGGLSLAAAQV